MRRWWRYRVALKRRRTRRAEAKQRLVSERWSVLALIDTALKQKDHRDVAKYGRRLASIDRQHGCPILKGSSVQIGDLAKQLAELTL